MKLETIIVLKSAGVGLAATVVLFYGLFALAEIAGWLMSHGPRVYWAVFGSLEFLWLWFLCYKIFYADKDRER